MRGGLVPLQCSGSGDHARRENSSQPGELFNVQSDLRCRGIPRSREPSVAMCGIAGMLLRHGRADEGALRRMAAALAHRGPDDLGVHVAGTLGLANARLSMIALEHGHQPMLDERLALVANGEIYNFIELRSGLEARGRRFETASDSETILHAYALDGLAWLPSLNGMFAFALHDAEKRELVLARDRLGIKPLYYAQLPDRLLFASEIKALLAVWPSEPELDP